MMFAQVARINSYDDEDGIQHFVDAALSMDPDIEILLRNGNRSRLVVLKPNWIQESHEYKPDVWEAVITHPNLVLAVIRRVAQMMEGQGSICVCDAPHTYASFQSILGRGNFLKKCEEVRKHWPALNLEVLDLRREIWSRKEEVVVERRPGRDDPRGYVCFNLKKDSLFYGHSGEGKYYGADYDSRIVNEHHCGERHEYLLAGTPIACDLFINLPKIKTHKKTGITCCLKNLVGINGDKNWLPHYTEGCPENRGDEFPDSSLAHSLERGLKHMGRKVALNLPLVGTWIYRKMRNIGKEVFSDSEKVIRNGNWSGNDTCWRMALDLNRCLLYGNADGTWREGNSPKRYLAIVDGIVGGEGNGPLCCESVPSNVLISGMNPAIVDAVTSRLMGFTVESLPIVKNAFESHRWPIADCELNEILIEDERCNKRVALGDLGAAIPQGFKPHFGWKHLRRKEL